MAPGPGPFLPPCPGAQDPGIPCVTPSWRRGLALSLTCSGLYQAFLSWQVQHRSGQRGPPRSLTVPDTWGGGRDMGGTDSLASSCLSVVPQ